MCKIAIFCNKMKAKVTQQSPNLLAKRYQRPLTKQYGTNKKTFGFKQKRIIVFTTNFQFFRQTNCTEILSFQRLYCV
ncbi:unnamed protein product [Ceratitis capitata]|uniref:(Mediterranean fruit fly) hypothetical protein n=1 Tax=Ceratitis capitata TaxID=7213 RepID=A0A811UQP4_CERCA|nr:unnamed protein product [Ceratitis capitata]